MEYTDGKLFEQIIEQKIDEKLVPINQALGWIIKAMRDNDNIPKEEKK